MRAQGQAAEAGSSAGTQSIDRTITVIKALSSRGQLGWQLTDLARQCGLSKSTTHRILQCLASHWIVSRREKDGLYLPGSFLFSAGLSVPGMQSFYQHATQRVACLAQNSELVASLYFRSADEAVFAHRAGKAGYSSISRVGSRSPLVATFGGVAILLTLPRQAASSIVKRNLAALDEGEASRRHIHSEVYEESRRAAMVVSRAYLLHNINIVGVGLPIRSTNGTAFAAVTLMGTREYFPDSKLNEARSLLQDEADRIEAYYAEVFPERVTYAGA